MKAQSDRYLQVADRVKSERETLLHQAYEALVKFVTDILKYSDGQDEIGSLGVQFLPDVVRSFTDLAKYNEQVIDQESIEEVESTQEIGENGQIIQKIKNLDQRLTTDLNGLSQVSVSACITLQENMRHEAQARSALSEARDKQSVGRQKLLSLAQETDSLC